MSRDQASQHTQTNIMTTAIESSAVLGKTRELCQAIVDQPEFQQLRASIDAFLADEDARSLYQSVMEKGNELQQKQRMGMELPIEEISAFENQRASLFGNPVARSFLEAQQQMHEVQSSVTKWVTKTFEIGRVPTEEDLAGCGCSSGCGCH
jgi:cell fate (sporulation/competence/biofilm development) regulator YlbF (YheA/YmcA/DUF963 family)